MSEINESAIIEAKGSANVEKKRRRRSMDIPKNFEGVCNRFMLYELSAKEAANELNITYNRFYELLYKYKDYGTNKRTLTNRFRNSEEFEAVYTKFMAFEVTIKEAAELLHISPSAFINLLNDLKNYRLKKRDKTNPNVKYPGFDIVYSKFIDGKITHKEAAKILGINDLTFMRCVSKYKKGAISETDNNTKLQKKIASKKAIYVEDFKKVLTRFMKYQIKPKKAARLLGKNVPSFDTLIYRHKNKSQPIGHDHIPSSQITFDEVCQKFLVCEISSKDAGKLLGSTTKSFLKMVRKNKAINI